MRLALILVLAMAFLVPATVEAAPDPASPPAAPAPVDPTSLLPRMIGPEYLLRLAEHHEGADANLALLAQLEQQGLVDAGTVDRAASAAASGAFSSTSGPAVVFYDFHPACDVNGDGVTDLVANVFDMRTWSSSIAMFNGANGEYLWVKGNSYYIPLFAVSGGIYPDRVELPRPSLAGPPKLPYPTAPPNMASPGDLDGDGVCDILALGTSTVENLNAAASATIYNTTIQAVSGKTHAVIWSRSFEPLRAVVGTDPPQVESVVIRNFPTGFLATVGATGPRLFLKLTDLTFTIAHDDVVTGYAVYDYRVDDHIYDLDASAKGKGATLWLRNLTTDTDQDATNFTFLTGAADLAGSTEPEVVFDSFWVATPRSNLAVDDPTSGKPIFREGKGVGITALRGEDGATLWGRAIAKESFGKVNLQSEDKFWTIRFSYGQMLPDFTGDGRADFVVLYYTQELNEDGTLGGLFKTHIHPVDGASGSDLWAADKMYRGWGYAASLATAQGAPPLLAFGSVDPPLIGEVNPGGRFPAKFVQVRVLSLRDGTTAWEPYQDRYSQDNYLPFEFALRQYRTSLAPFDWDHDGVLDVVTPAHYVKPVAAEQVLLSTSKHEYRILSGATGKRIATVTAWGPTGYAMGCPGADSMLTVIGGHARRLDVSRLDPMTGARVWRRPIYNDGRVQGSTLGSELLALSATCAEVQDATPWTMTGASFWRLSPSRGQEIAPLLAHLPPGGQGGWITPALDPDPGILNYLELLPQPAQAASVGDHAVANAGPALLGLLGGAGVGVARNRARKPKEGLA